MIKEIDKEHYYKLFPKDPHAFISRPFVDHYEDNVDRVVYLISSTKKKKHIGLIAGLKHKCLISNFSSPYGGFHFRHEQILIEEIDLFFSALKNYAESNHLLKISITLPPDIYSQSVNAKLVNSLFRNDYHMKSCDITQWVDLKNFDGKFSCKSANKNYQKSIKGNLEFNICESKLEKESSFNLIVENRKRFNRPIFMSFNDVQSITKLWRVDFFKVSKNKSILASAIAYRSRENIVNLIFWGDNEIGRCMNSMDFLSFNLWQFYKNLGFDYVDIGTSSSNGIPNTGLTRFKETHEGISSLRYSFEWIDLIEN